MNAPLENDPIEHVPRSPEESLLVSQSSTFLLSRVVELRKILRFAAQRGFAKFQDLDLNSGCLTTAGVLLGTRSTKKVVFADLTNGRDQIQLVLRKELPETQPKQPELQRGGRVLVTGVPFLAGRFEAKPIPSLFVVKLLSYSLPTPVAFDETGFYREVTPRLVIGRLMSLLSEHLERAGYVRYEPRFITSSLVGLDTEPLVVRFPGRGADLLLEVSPLPQLLYAAVMTGTTKLYSPTRLFCRAYRDGLTSADSPIIAAVEIETSGSRKPRLEDATKSLVSGFNREELHDLPLDPIPDNIVVVVDGTASAAPGNSVLIRLRNMPSPVTSQYAYDIRQRVEVVTPPGQVLIEGHEGKIAQEISYNWLCVHVERMTSVDSWRIAQRRGLES